MTLIRIALFKSDPSGVDVPANGYLQWRPSKRRHVEDPDDHNVLPSAFTVRLGEDFLDEDGEIVTAGEPGIAWAEVDPTDIPDWAWTVVERTDRGRGRTWVEVPDQALVEYADLTELDPDTLDPEVEPEAAWDVELESRVPDEGTDGYVLTKGTPDNVWTAAGSGTGDVVGPGSSTDNRVVRMDGTTGKTIQESPVTIDDAGAITGMTTVDGRDVSADGTALDSHIANTSNPHAVTKAQVGLGSVDNTSDAGKPVSTAQQTALDLKANSADLATVATSGDYDDLINTPPANLPVSLTEGANIDISGAYPDFTIAGTDAPVQSVNTQTGDVVLGSDDVPAGATNKYVTAAEKTKLSTLSGTNTGDQDLSGLVPTSRTVNGHALSGNVTVTAADTGADASGAAAAAQAAAIAVSAQRASNLSDLANAGTARTNLGLGSAATTASSAYATAAQGTKADSAIQPGAAAGGVLSGTYPNPGFAADMATQAELDAEATTRSDDDQTLATGLSDEATARDNADIALNDAFGAGLATKQPLDSDLTTIAGLTATTDNIIQSVGSAWASRTPAQVKTALAIAEADVSGLVADLAAKQPLDSDLTTIAGLTATTDNMLQSVGSAWASRTPAQVKTALGLSNVSDTSDATKNSATATLTNKRITKRVVSTADTATLTIDSDAYDGAKVTALAQAMTIAAPTGTPTAMQSLIIRILDNGTARALTWNAAFRAIGVTLPTTTVISKTVYVGAVWNVEDSKWDVLAVAAQA